MEWKDRDLVWISSIIRSALFSLPSRLPNSSALNHEFLEQGSLESTYKQKLSDDYGIVFNNLFTLSNMPIKRFADFLHRQTLNPKP